MSRSSQSDESSSSREPHALVRTRLDKILYKKASVNNLSHRKNPHEHETSALCANILIHKFLDGSDNLAYAPEFPPVTGSRKRVDHVIRFRPKDTDLLLPLFFVECKRPKTATSESGLAELEVQLQKYFRSFMNVVDKRREKDRSYPEPRILYGAAFAGTRIRLFTFDVTWRVLLPMWQVSKRLPNRGSPEEYYDVGNGEHTKLLNRLLNQIRDSEPYNLSPNSRAISSGSSSASSTSPDKNRALVTEMQKGNVTFAYPMQEMVKGGMTILRMAYLADKSSEKSMWVPKRDWEKKTFQSMDGRVKIDYFRYTDGGKDKRRFWALTLDSPALEGSLSAKAWEMISADPPTNMTDEELEYGPEVRYIEKMTFHGPYYDAVDSEGQKYTLPRAGFTRHEERFRLFGVNGKVFVITDIVFLNARENAAEQQDGDAPAVAGSSSANAAMRAAPVGKAIPNENRLEKRAYEDRGRKVERRK